MTQPPPWKYTTIGLSVPSRPGAYRRTGTPSTAKSSTAWTSSAGPNSSAAVASEAARTCWGVCSSSGGGASAATCSRYALTCGSIISRAIVRQVDERPAVVDERQPPLHHAAVPDLADED